MHIYDWISGTFVLKIKMIRFVCMKWFFLNVVHMPYNYTHMRHVAAGGGYGEWCSQHWNKTAINTVWSRSRTSCTFMSAFSSTKLLLKRIFAFFIASLPWSQESSEKSCQEAIFKRRKKSIQRAAERLREFIAFHRHSVGRCQFSFDTIGKSCRVISGSCFLADF